MKPITKKRFKAVLIDGTISGVISLGVEQFLRKKVKKEWVHAVVTPTVVMWGLEYALLRNNQQTFGYKAMGLTLESEDSEELSPEQIMKRIAYRDTLSPFLFLIKRKNFEAQDGATLPHDRIAHTTVKEIPKN